MDAYETIRSVCLSANTTDPIALLLEIADSPAIRMHGPEHHVLDGACFLTAMHNAGMDFDLAAALDELIVRGKKMPGATCGQWGMCGSASSIGAAMSILCDTGPLSSDAAYQNHLRFVSRALAAIAEVGGPRCCKRNAFLSLTTAIDFVKEIYGIVLPQHPISCCFQELNKQCIHARCPFDPKN